MSTKHEMFIYPIVWPVIESLCRSLVRDIEWEGIRGIYGEPRGGLIPATIMSHMTGIPLVTNLWDAGGNMPAMLNEVLWVDDIIDSGLAATNFLNNHSDIKKQVALFGREDSENCGLLTALNVPPNYWLVFPWESQENARKDLEAYENSR